MNLDDFSFIVFRINMSTFFVIKFFLYDLQITFGRLKIDGPV